jgi:ribosome-interacting GTPase 1
MPTNVTPEYMKAKAAYRRASDPRERLQCLQEMLRLIPKHKGTEHVQAELKSKIKQLTGEAAAAKKSGGRIGPVHAVRPEGAAQVVLIGPPNSGKSSLHAKLTGSHAEIGAYPNTTHAPLPGMLSYEDVHFQLVDLPPISTTYMESWMPNALQQAHAALLVVNLAAAGCVESVVAIRNRLEEKRITLTPDWPGHLHPGPVDRAEHAQEVTTIESPPVGDADEDDPFRIVLPTLVVATRSDIRSMTEEIDTLEELVGVCYPAIEVSNESGEGLDGIGPLLFNGLEVVRVYTKVPGHPPEEEKPYTVFRGATVHDVAQLVHRDMAESLKFARVWGSTKFDGQQVGRDHTVADGDVVELHT